MSNYHSAFTTRAGPFPTQDAAVAACKAMVAKSQKEHKTGPDSRGCLNPVVRDCDRLDKDNTSQYDSQYWVTQQMDGRQHMDQSVGCMYISPNPTCGPNSINLNTAGMPDTNGDTFCKNKSNDAADFCRVEKPSGQGVCHKNKNHSCWCDGPWHREN